MLTINAWQASQRILSGLTICSAVALMSACGSDDPDASSSDVSSTASSSTSTATTSSSSSSAPTNTPSSSSAPANSSSSAPSTVGEVPADPVPNGKYRVNAQGKITDDGNVFDVQCGNWFGLEGQHEPSDAEVNPGGAPLELYIGNMWWDEASSRTISQTMQEIKDLGINMIRLPIAPQTLEQNPPNPQGTGRITATNKSGALKNSGDAYPYDNAREAMLGFLGEAQSAGLKVLVDIHSCSNYVGWRAGKLDAQPPYVDRDRVGYDFTREEYDCLDYGETKWLADLRDIAEIANQYDNIIGIDIFNEPWDYTWDQWATLSEKAYEAISEVNTDVLVFVEGVGSGLYDGTDVEHGDEDTNPNWGENFYGFNERPLQIPRERVVISPHTYGPAVFVQHHFLASDCQGVQVEGDDGESVPIAGDAAGEANCQIDIGSNISTMEAGWEEHFGFLRDMNYAIVIGEFGGNMDWPQIGTRQGERDMWEHVTNTPDIDWQNAFVDYAIEEQIQACYWSINPESADTGGLYLHEWDPVTNEEGWGKWGDFDTRKTNLVQRLWNNAR